MIKNDFVALRNLRLPYEKMLTLTNCIKMGKHCHTLKGVFANLAITPLYDMFNTLTEELRSKTVKDYSNEAKEIIALFEKVKAIIIE